MTKAQRQIVHDEHRPMDVAAGYYTAVSGLRRLASAAKAILRAERLARGVAIPCDRVM